MTAPAKKSLKKKILVVDDEKNITFVMQTLLEKSGYSPVVSNDPVAALALFDESFTTVITDLYMPRMNGMELFAQIRKRDQDVPIIIMTAFGTVESAVNALKAGAFDYVTKPFEQDELLRIVEKAVNTFSLRKLEPSPSVESQSSIHVGHCPQMKEVARIIQKTAASPTTVLITGESGTGKELVATAIHRLSDRVHKPFIKINCAALPHSLIESELFGYEKGAFTGAVHSKPGRFELAHEGTLFLDEVGEMPIEMQVKLLRVIQESEFERVGGLSTIKVNVRLIAATNKALSEEVKAGRFREDLFYRLNVVPIQLPALRERKSDIEELIYFFIRKFNDKLGKQVASIDPECMKRLQNYYWPGNVRQLENVLEHAVLMSEMDLIRLRDLPRELSNLILEDDAALGLPITGGPNAPMEVVDAVAALESGEPFKDIVKRQTQILERELIGKALDDHQGNVTKTAEMLGLSRKGLQIKMKELGLRETAGG